MDNLNNLDIIVDILQKYYDMIDKYDVSIDDLSDLNKLSDDQKKIVEMMILFYKLGNQKRYEYRSASP